MSGGPQKYDLKLKDGTAYDEAISGLQKMIRRGLEKEAMAIAIDLMESGYGMSLAKRLIVISAEDIGLADPITAANATTMCVAYITLKKASNSGYVDMMPLCMACLMRPPVERIAFYSSTAYEYRGQPLLDEVKAL